MGSRSILCGPVRPSLRPFDSDPFSDLEDMVGVKGPPPSESVRDRLVMAGSRVRMCGVLGGLLEGVVDARSDLRVRSADAQCYGVLLLGTAYKRATDSLAGRSEPKSRLRQRRRVCGGCGDGGGRECGSWVLRVVLRLQVRGVSSCKMSVMVSKVR